MTITVYTTRVCPACNMLKTFLDKKEIEYDTKVIGEDITPEEFFKATGAQSVPVTDVDGNQVIGMDLAKLGPLLNI